MLAKQLHDLAQGLGVSTILGARFQVKDLELLLDCFRASLREALGSLWNAEVGAALNGTFTSFLGVMEPALSMVWVGSKLDAFLRSQHLAVAIENVDEESKELVRPRFGGFAAFALARAHSQT